MKNIKLQENNDNLLMKLEVYKKKYLNLKQKFVDLQGKYNTLLLSNLAVNQDNSSFSLNFPLIL